METFSFSIPQHVIFGKGSLGKLPEAAKALGKNKALIISGPHLNRIGMVDKCRAALSAAGIGSAAFTETEGNPSTETVEKAVDAYKSSGADFIVAFGGGSPLDVAKAAGILAMYGGKITEYEGGGKVPGPVVPMIAIPTTAGTGSEVTSFSVITDHSRNYKLSVSSNYLLPAYAILDPELIASVPAGTAAACGVDAMVHALEAYLSLAASPFSDMFALKALQLIGKNLRAYAANRGNEAAAEAMMMGSLFAGIAFSHARLGDVHAMSHPVSAYFNVAHGVANAILLPVIVEYNELADQGKYYDIYRCVAKAPVSEAMFSSHMLTEELRALNMELGIPSCLKEAGVKAEYFDAMAEDAMKSGNISVNPRSTTKADVLELYKKAF
ncbi:MAG TPA: iron-containing alcohol dehydrogenase [Candidatus Choladocola avistercoris]|nr:iron-containing alcohol dehydrogenase [Candidatus Choladocola avistercoris]